MTTPTPSITPAAGKDIVGVWFSFGPDYPCLVQSIRSFRRIFGQDTPCCVYDDASNPISADDIATLQLAHYEQTDWPRRGNLNGGPCILGILSCYRDAVDRTGAALVIKTDCDTVIGSDWIDHNPRWAMQGIWWDASCFMSGAQYAIRADVPGIIASKIAHRLAYVTGPGSGEDRTISHMVAIYCPGELLVHDSTLGAERRIGCGYQYTPDSFRTCAAFPIVTFGNRHLIMEADHNKRRAIAADHMRRYLDYLDARDRLPQAPPPDAVGTPSLKA